MAKKVAKITSKKKALKPVPKAVIKRAKERAAKKRTSTPRKIETTAVKGTVVGKENEEIEKYNVDDNGTGYSIEISGETVILVVGDRELQWSRKTKLFIRAEDLNYGDMVEETSTNQENNTNVENSPNDSEDPIEAENDSNVED